jgi:hypothetical protein
MGREWVDFRDEWDDRQADKASGVITPEVEKALDLAEELTKPAKIVPKRVNKSGDKRRIKHGSWEREPLDGYSLEHSNIARHVIGLKYAGYALKEAFDDASQKYELLPHSIENLYYGKKDLFELADAEHIENAIREYHTNLVVCRTMLSESGPRAVQTILDVMDDPKSTPNVRSKTAIAVLKMLNIDGSATANPGEGVAKESLKLVRDMINQRGEDKGSHVIDAEDVEVLDERDECGN